MNNKVKRGVWTPWAIIQCVECHGPKFPNKEFNIESEEWLTAISPQKVKQGFEITNCDNCGESIQIYKEVAREHNLALALQKRGIEAEMWQTGGMNSACGINKIGFNGSEHGEEHYYLITYDFDGDGLFFLGSYGADGDYFEEESFATEDFDEMISHVLSLKDVKRLNQG